jgi:hypothetical protein
MARFAVLKRNPHGATMKKILRSNMKYKSVFAVLLLCLACAPQAPGDRSEGDNTMTATLPEWFSNGKFGMFIHWGPYSVLGGEWKGKRIEQGDIAEWIMERFHIPVEEYRKVAA